MNKRELGRSAACLLATMLLAGCGENEVQDSKEQGHKAEREIVGTYEAERAELSQNLSVKDSIKGFSGEGYPKTDVLL